MDSIFKRLWFRFVPDCPVRCRRFGLDYLFSLRDHPRYWWASRNQTVSDSLELVTILEHTDHTLWDVGCNAGLFSVAAAAHGKAVLAFDISPVARNYTLVNAKNNGCRVVMFPGMSTSSYQYDAPDTGRLGNMLKRGGINTETTVIWQDIARRYGTPSLIKMDIEGHELVFLQDDAFKQWLRANGVVWLLETHSDDLDMMARGLATEGFQCEPVESRTYLILPLNT
jgi:FkbM family methyltransferase